MSAPLPARRATGPLPGPGPSKLLCRDRILDLGRTAIMGVLNVTPDSFSDGGRYLSVEDAVARGAEMAAEGAGVIDVGGESTRPGASSVPEAEELGRVLPVIEQLSGSVHAILSIDTRKPSVARLAIEAGASIVNDTTGEAAAGLADVARSTGSALVVMHSRGTPETMTSLTDYGDVVADVVAYFEDVTSSLAADGLGPERVVVDPGFGFAKTPVQSLALLRDLGRFTALGYAVLAGTSRKSFLGALLGAPEDERVFGTAASVAWAVAAGARIVRVHDVKAMAEVAWTTEAIMGVDATTRSARR
jgi:dihydropteroate synthase